MYVVAGLLFLSLQTGCLRQQEQPPVGSRSGYAGCLSAVASGKNSAIITVDLPDKATEVEVYRDGKKIGSVFPGNADGNTFSDAEIPVQGETYRYSCRAIIDGEGKVGYNEPTLYTEPANAPSFSGIKSVTIVNKVQALIAWEPAETKGDTVSKVAKYKIYANLNRATGSAQASIDYSKDPIIELSSSTTNSYTIESGLGDNLPYVFAVSACTINNLCSGTTVFKTASTEENGSPSNNTGISSMGTMAGGVTVVAPWTENMGEIKKRYLYMGTLNSTNIGDYTPIKTFSLTLDDLKIPNNVLAFTNFEVPDSRIHENTQYYFAVVDQDSLGNRSPLIPFSLATGDLTAPTFGGITDIQPNGAQPSTAMDITFNASNTEGAPNNDSAGASSYIVEYTGTPYVDGATTWPDNPCTSGTRYASSFAANPGGVGGGSSVTITVDGLNPRVYYRFCVRAVDAAGNESADLNPTSMIPTSTLDTQAPVFDGIQGLSGVVDGGEYKIKAEWNVAEDSASAVQYYRLKIWSNNADSNAASDTTLVYRSAIGSSAYDTGTLIVNGADFSYGEGQKVYVLVDACDTADDIPNGTINCTAYPDVLAMSITPPDIVPPQNFTGISSAVSATNNGEATVTWFAPSSWSSDYFGFRIYSVDASNNNALSLLKTCTCASPGNCASPGDLSCKLTNLNANRKIRFHVRAVDATGNETTYINPVVSWEEATIKDTIAPSFNNPNLQGAWNSGAGAIALTWTQATDNQFTGDITYEIYRKIPGAGDFTAGEIANPSSPRAQITNTGSFTDVDATYAAVGGGDYYYLICARDAQNNRTCDTKSVKIALPDVAPPVFTQNVTSTKATDGLNKLRVWTLNFKVTDNNSRLERMRINVYRTYSTVAEIPADIDGNLDPQAQDETNITLDTGNDEVTINNLIGKSQNSGYVNYLVVVADEYGNKTSQNVSYTYDTKITIASVASNKANADITKSIVIQGTGFTKGTENGSGTDTTVTLGSFTCSNTTVYSGTVMTCDTPTGTGGQQVDVVVSNPDGVSATLSLGFTFTNGTTFAHDPCDTTAMQNGSPFATGAGTLASPWIVCTGAQFVNLANASYNVNGKYAKLGAHVDLNAAGWTAPTNFYINLDGQGFMLYNSPSGRIFGVIANTATADTTIENIIFFNNTMSGAGGILATAVTASQNNTYIKNLSFINNNMGAQIGGVLGTSLQTYPGSFGNVIVDGISISGSNHTGGSTNQSLLFNQAYCYGNIFGYCTTTSGGTFTIKNIAIDNILGTPKNPNLFSSVSGFINELSNISIDASNLNNIDFTFAQTLGSLGTYVTYAGIGNINNISISTPTQDNSLTYNSVFYSSARLYGDISNVTYTWNYSQCPSASTFNITNLLGSGNQTISNIDLSSIKCASDTTPGGPYFFSTLNFYGDTPRNLIFEKLKFAFEETSFGYFALFSLLNFNGSGLSENHKLILKNSEFTISNSSFAPTASNSLGGLLGEIRTNGYSPAPTTITPSVEIENCKIELENQNSGLVRQIPAITYTPVNAYVKITNSLLVINDTNLIDGNTTDTERPLAMEWFCNGTATGSSGVFYNSDLSTQFVAGQSGTCDGYTGASTAQLKDSTAGNVLETAGWDFTNIWQWPTGGGYPTLR